MFSISYVGVDNHRTRKDRVVLIRNIASNVIGTVLPAAVAILVVPHIIGHLGTAGFGIFSLQVALLFFLGLSDLGIGRAIVLIALEDTPGKLPLPWLRPYVVGLHFSRILACGVVVLALPIMFTVAHLDQSGGSINRTDLVVSSGVYACSAAVMLLSLAPRAVLESQQKFVIVNMIRGPGAVFIFLGPLIALQFSESLTLIAVMVLISRIIFTAAYFLALPRSHKSVRQSPWEDAELHKAFRSRFLARAGWFGTTNLLSMAVFYLDRFILGAMGSALVVGEYGIAQEIATKLWIVSGALMSAAVPQLASAAAKGQKQLSQTVQKVFAWMLAAGLLPSIILIYFARPILHIWLRTAFVPESVILLQLMVVGIGVNNFTQINFSLLQIHGGERIGTFLQVAGLVIALASLGILVPRYGAQGAAVAWTIRLSIDAMLVRLALTHSSPAANVGISIYRQLLLLVGLLLLFSVADH